MTPSADGPGTLADLLPSVGAHLGQAGEDAFDLPDARRYALLLVDGLGVEQLRRHAAAAPFLAGLPDRGASAVWPSTTAACLTSLGTGLPVGQHGVVGYSFRFAGQLLPVLRWPKGLRGEDVQPRLTWLERLDKAGVAVTVLSLGKFKGSGLTQAGLRGGSFWGTDETGPAALRAAKAAMAASLGERSFTYVYERGVDHAGHESGVGSPQWLAQVARADELARELRNRLPQDVVLLVTGDHGMVNVARADRVTLEAEPALAEGVELVAGEARFRHLYTAAPDAVRQRWAEFLGDRAVVATRDEAVAAGWFGEASNQVADRIGDVVVACQDAQSGPFAVMTRTFPKEFNLRGMHGSTSPAETRVPLLVAV
ncbi:MAG: alkaline phosphatase family protein [Propionibacteriaceae bacterium]|nr:alkaline phosphatase family protein [Propionibacteriaceae bacterium]